MTCIKTGIWIVSIALAALALSVDLQARKNQRADPAANDARAGSGPIHGINNNNAPDAVTNQNQDKPVSVKVIAPVSAQRDKLDYAFIVFTGALVIVTFLQWRLLSWTFVADHRPKLEISHVALANDPDKIHITRTTVLL
jgi:hypothetical protein